MHGRKRAEYKAKMRDPQVAAGLQHKANQWYKLSAVLLQATNSNNNEKNDSSSSSSSSALELTSNLLLVNPDPLYIWNKRRELLLSQETDVNSAAAGVLDVGAELVLTQKCLERNPKAYGAWFHRKWLVGYKTEHVNLQRELGLTTEFLNYDERNFHCWNYRRFVVACLCGTKDGDLKATPSNADTSNNEKQIVLFGAQVGNVTQGDTDTTQQQPSPLLSSQQILDILREELDFTTQKIAQNFSNGSAFHYRSKLLAVLSVDIAAELELIHNAVFTEPDDQTAWWYLEYLLENYANDIDLEEEREMLEELISAEDGKTKWGLLGLYQVLQRMEGQYKTRQLEILEQLQTLDPDRKMRYRSMSKTLENSS